MLEHKALRNIEELSVSDLQAKNQVHSSASYLDGTFFSLSMKISCKICSHHPFLSSFGVQTSSLLLHNSVKDPCLYCR